MSNLYKKIVTLGMISFTAVLAWIYCVLEYRTEIVYVAIVSLVLIISVYALLQSAAKLKAAKDAELQSYVNETINSAFARMPSSNDTEELEKLSKASYVQVRKINTILTQMSENNVNCYQHGIESYNNLSASTQQIITDTINKAVKVMVKYNQTDNDKLLSAIQDLTNNLDKITDELEAVKTAIAEIEINVPVVTAPTVSQDMVDTANHVSEIDTQVVDDFSNETENININEILNGFEASTDDTFEQEIEPAIEPAIEPTIEPAEETSSDEIVASAPADPNAKLSADEIAALFEASKDEFRAETDNDFHVHHHPETMDQSLIDAILDSTTVIEPEPVDMPAEEADASETSMNDTTTENDISDTSDASAEADSIAIPAAPIDDNPNKQLSADEIAALIASMQ